MVDDRAVAKMRIICQKVTSKSQVCEMLAIVVVTELQVLYVIVMGHFCKLAPSVQRIVPREKGGNLSKMQSSYFSSVIITINNNNVVVIIICYYLLLFIIY